MMTCDRWEKTNRSMSSNGYVYNGCHGTTNAHHDHDNVRELHVLLDRDDVSYRITLMTIIIPKRIDK